MRGPSRLRSGAIYIVGDGCHAIGSLKLPLPEQNLKPKFRRLVAAIGGESSASRVIELIWNIDGIAKSSVPLR